jgi:hypothetical protein
MQIMIGTLLYGYCGGYFGDSYSTKRIEGFGSDWIVVRDSGGWVSFACFGSTEEMFTCVKSWSNISNKPEWVD